MFGFISSSHDCNRGRRDTTFFLWLDDAVMWLPKYFQVCTLFFSDAYPFSCQFATAFGEYCSIKGKVITKFSVSLTLKSSVSMRLLGTFTELTCRAGPLSLMLESLELGLTQSITGWVVPSSWLSTWFKQYDGQTRDFPCYGYRCWWEKREYVSTDHTVCSPEAAQLNCIMHMEICFCVYVCKD